VIAATVSYAIHLSQDDVMSLGRNTSKGATHHRRLPIPNRD
jgi:hypothetical protein